MIDDATRYPTPHPTAPATSSGPQERPRLSLRLGFIFSVTISTGIVREDHMEFGVAAILTVSIVDMCTENPYLTLPIET